MILLSRLAPVTSEETTLGANYVLLSEAQEQLYIMTEADIRFIQLFGRPVKYGLYSCVIEEADKPPVKDKSVPFYECKIIGMYKYEPRSLVPCDLSIDWSR